VRSRVHVCACARVSPHLVELAADLRYVFAQEDDRESCDLVCTKTTDLTAGCRLLVTNFESSGRNNSDNSSVPAIFQGFTSHDESLFPPGTLTALSRSERRPACEGNTGTE
jgi:hypothetical protein